MTSDGPRPPGSDARAGPLRLFGDTTFPLAKALVPGVAAPVARRSRALPAPIGPVGPPVTAAVRAGRPGRRRGAVRPRQSSDLCRRPPGRRRFGEPNPARAAGRSRPAR
ncbi:hypothetical protein GCM10009660_20280 [Catellatospora bangladeshensis]